MLEKHSGSGNDLGDDVIVSAGKLNKLVADSHGNGKKSELDKSTENDVVDPYEKTDDNTYKKHKDKEGRTASGVESALLSYVFNGKLKTLLIAENGFVLNISKSFWN